jgi:hypothetical protein
MKSKPTSQSAKKKTIKKAPSAWLKARHYFWEHSLWRRILSVLAVLILLYSSVMYGVGEWYIHKHSKEPLVIGTTFIPDYARSFGLDPKETLSGILKDLDIKHIRLVSYWNSIETQPGKYDFSELDWQMAMADQYGAKVSLAIGMRQPRWPECHEPSFIDASKPRNTWQPELEKFMTAVINRYKNYPALQSYQLENEYFMTVFGECKNFDRQRLVDEFNLTKKLDPNHKIIISRSNNWIGIPVRQPTPDEFGISVYKRVWDSTLTKRYFEYPLPAHFYAFLAGAEEIVSGKDMIIHEMQAEPWTPNGKGITETSVAEQFKSMNAERMKTRIDYAQSTGMRTIDLWGAEWWYWLKVKQDDPSVWNVVKDRVAKADFNNQLLEQTAKK